MRLMTADEKLQAHFKSISDRLASFERRIFELEENQASILARISSIIAKITSIEEE